MELYLRPQDPSPLTHSFTREHLAKWKDNRQICLYLAAAPALLFHLFSFFFETDFLCETCRPNHLPQPTQPRPCAVQLSRSGRLAGDIVLPRLVFYYMYNSVMVNGSSDLET